METWVLFVWFCQSTVLAEHDKTAMTEVSRPFVSETACEEFAIDMGIRTAVGRFRYVCVRRPSAQKFTSPRGD